MFLRRTGRLHKCDMKEKDIQFPECWEEVKPLEWMHLLKIRDRLMNRKGISLMDVKREWCAYVLKNRGYRFRSKVDDLLLVDEFAKTLGWMWQVSEEEGGSVVELTYDSTLNLIPRWRYLYGPASHGADMTFGEFRHAAAVMNRYNGSRDDRELLALCAILYRNKEQRKGGISAKEPFHPENMDMYMGRTQSMPVWMQWGIYVWFANFCQYLYTGTFIIDGLEICFAPVFERHKRDDGKETGAAQNLGMNGVLYSVAESGIFGNADATDNTLLLRVMLKLLDDKQRADEIMRRYK